MVAFAEAFIGAIAASTSAATSGKLHLRRPPTELPGLTDSQAENGVVHFMFLVNSSMKHVSLWKRFFAAAPPGSWRAWVHCADSVACSASGLFDALPDFVQ